MNGSRLLLSTALLLVGGPAFAGQAPFAAAAPDFPVSGRDRVYAAEQFSNTISVIDPSTNTNLGVIRLGDPQPMNLSPLYKGQVLVHGLGFSPDRKTLAVVSIASNSVTFVDTATNRVKHTTYVGRSPHEAFYTQDGSEVWVTVRGEDYVAVLDGKTYGEKARITVPNGPGMTIFSPDGRYGYVCSSFTPETVVISTETREIVGRVKQISPFCPNIAATPDGNQVWMTLKDVGKVMVFAAKPPFDVLRVIDTGPITNHVNLVQTPRGQFAYVTIGGLNQVKVFRTTDFEQVTTISVGDLPHGIWPSGDGSRVYVGIENGDAVTAIDTATNRVVATIPNGQAAQALVYVPEAAPAAAAGDRKPAAARSRWLGLALRADRAWQQQSHDGFVVRPGADAGAAGRGRRPRAGQALRARAHHESRRDRDDRADRSIHDQPCRRADRQCRGAHSPDRGSGDARPQ